MANAGRVSVVPKGNWQADIKYSRLDFVKYSSALYLAKKDVPLGTLPTDTDYWMFCGETDISEVASAINNIIDGTTTVGKAWKDSDGNFINTTYAKGVDLTDHIDSSVTDADGVHDFKVDAEEKKAYAKINGTWVEIAGGGGGSSKTTFNITTTATSLAGKTVELYTVDGVKVTQSSFIDSLSCIISISISAGNYYLLCDDYKYEISIIATGNTITIDFDEATYHVTFTVTGANEDNITISGNGITPVNVIFGTSQTSKSVTMTLTPLLNGKTFTFTSTVAKDTTNGTSNYVKNIAINKFTTNVKVMPENVVYWYGNKVLNMVQGGRINDTWDYAPFSITYKTHYFDALINSDVGMKGSKYISENNIDITNYSKIKFKIDAEITYIGTDTYTLANVYCSDIGYEYLSHYQNTQNSFKGIATIDLSSKTGETSVGFWLMNQRTNSENNTSYVSKNNFYAIWFE